MTVGQFTSNEMKSYVKIALITHDKTTVMAPSEWVR